MVDFKYIISKPQEMEPFCKSVYTICVWFKETLKIRLKFGTKELSRIVSMAYTSLTVLSDLK